MTVTVTTNETSINATVFPEPVMESSGMGMVLIPFGIITVLGLAVAIVRKYLQIHITRLGLVISEENMKHVCVFKSAFFFAIISSLNYNTSQTAFKRACLC